VGTLETLSIHMGMSMYFILSDNELTLDFILDFRSHLVHGTMEFVKDRLLFAWLGLVLISLRWSLKQFYR